MGKHGKKLTSCALGDDNIDNDFDDSLTDSSSVDGDFMIDFVNNYFELLEVMDIAGIIDREPVDDLVCSIIDYENEYYRKLKKKHFILIADHFYINSNILMSHYLMKKNMMTL